MKAMSNKVAVITGGNSGIGFATARRFVAEGARVVIVGRRCRRRSCRSPGRAGHRDCRRRRNTRDTRRVATLARERFEAVDIYMANAGGIRIQSGTAVTPDDYDAQFDTNARGTFFGVKAIVPVMRDGGAILLTSSIATHKVLGGHAVYAGSKAAIEAFARS